MTVSSAQRRTFAGILENKIGPNGLNVFASEF